MPDLDPKTVFRAAMAKQSFGMLVLKKGAAAGVNNPKDERVAVAKEAFMYADAFIEVCIAQGCKPWEWEE